MARAPQSNGSEPDFLGWALILIIFGLPLQLLGEGVAAGWVLVAATDYASLDAVSWLTFTFPLPGLLLLSIAGFLLIRTAKGRAARERFGWRVLLYAWTLHLHGWLLLWMYFWVSSDVPRWIALVAGSTWALTVILVVRMRWARIQGRLGPEASLTLADFGIASVASALTICAALLTPIGVDGVLLFWASPAGAATALAGILGLAAAVATRNDKSPGRGPEIPRLGDVPRSFDP